MSDLDQPFAARFAVVQQKLNVPKNRRNNFGGYNYRSAEDILAKAKDLCIEHGIILTVQDEIVQFPATHAPQVFVRESKDSKGNTKANYDVVGGDRFYIKATATATDAIHPESFPFTATGFAREEDFKTGMDSSQLTGATSSYARKYALNGLFAIDDTKDADTDEHQTEVRREPASPKGSAATKKPAAPSSNSPTPGTAKPSNAPAPTENPASGTANDATVDARLRPLMNRLHADFKHAEIHNTAVKRFNVESVSELSFEQLIQLEDWLRHPGKPAAEPATLPIATDPDTPTTYTELWTFLKSHGIKNQEALIEAIGHEAATSSDPATAYAAFRTYLLTQ